jgi:hypothetical protein
MEREGYVKVRVKEGVSGVHTLTDITLVPGEEHTIPESCFGDEIFERVIEDTPKGKSKADTKEAKS